MSEVRIEAADALDFHLSPRVWEFARARRAEIAAHWAKRQAEQPALFNGRVLMLGRHGFETRDGRRVLAGEFIETDFADLLYYREGGFPPADACNGFSMAALRGADGAFLLGEMGSHTASAGAIYFPAGTPDRQDLSGDVVDLEASARRELFEETGLQAEEAEIAPGWDIVLAHGRVGCFKPMRLAIPAEAAKARIEATLAAQAIPEFSRIHVVARESDFTPAIPGFVRAYMARVFQDEAGPGTSSRS